MAHKFFMADVFTDRPFGGNQLAVFPDGREISDKAMQAYAREINFAETTFVLPPKDPSNTVRVRIFTPRAEMPFAGHPTVGTAAVLAHLGRLSDERIVFEEGIGPVEIEIDRTSSPLLARLVFAPKLERPSANPGTVAAAESLSLQESDVAAVWFASVGLRFCFVQLKSKDAVDRAALNRPAWSRHFANAWASEIYLFSGDAASGGSLYARMFAPVLGVEEDPATGSAAATLAAAFAAESGDSNGTCFWTINQGVAMGRPSRISASAEKRDGKVTRVSVGGPTVIVGEGLMMVSI